MSKKLPDDEWTESLFNDPRQIAMEFTVHPESDFETFHNKNPQIWRDFRKLVLDHFNRGNRTLDLGAIMKEVTGGVTLKSEITDKYWNLFISNHQELQNVFVVTKAPEHTPT